MGGTQNQPVKGLILPDPDGPDPELFKPQIGPMG